MRLTYIDRVTSSRGNAPSSRSTAIALHYMLVFSYCSSIGTALVCWRVYYWYCCAAQFIVGVTLRYWTCCKIQKQKALKTLFIVATYTIGKEKILLRIADQCKCKIVVDKRKMKILECLELMDQEKFENTFTLDSVSVLVVYNSSVLGVAYLPRCVHCWCCGA